MEVWNKIVESIVDFGRTLGTSILEAVAILLIGVIVIRLIVTIAKALFSRSKIEGGAASFFVSCIKAALILILFFIILDIFQIDSKSMVSIVAASGLAIGLALQNSISNLAAGIIMILTKPFKEGEYVAIDTAEGTVKSIKITTTEILTTGNIIIKIPNNKVITSNIMNYSERPTRRVDCEFNVSPENDIDTLKNCLYDLAINTEFVLTNPPVAVIMKAVSQTSVTMAVRMWCLNGNYWTVKAGYYERAIKEFQKLGIIGLPTTKHSIAINNDDEMSEGKKND